MAELRDHFRPSAATTDVRHGPQANPAALNWPLSSEDDLDLEPEQPRGCIELHGSAYIAFCKPWGPLFVAPEEEDEEAV